MSECDFDKILSVLSDTNQKPWMTAHTIAKKIKGSVGVDQVERLLLNHMDTAEYPKIRYSSLPSKKTLRVLWGALERVKDRQLQNLTKDYIADDSLDDIGELGEHCAFFSHSHKDYDAVIDIAKNLAIKGKMPWLAETHIDKNEGINSKIIEAIESNKNFILYLSKNALNSKWTSKEFSYAHDNDQRVFVIVDLSCSQVRDFVTTMQGENENLHRRAWDYKAGNLFETLIALNKDFKLFTFLNVDEIPGNFQSADRCPVKSLSELVSEL